MSVELVCIDPARVREFWPHVSELIHKAVLRTGLNHTRDIDDEVLSGKGLLWIAWNGRKIEAAATTVLQKTSKGLVCVLTACSGEGRENWLHLLAEIEQHAKNEGCACVRILGRRGWSRVLPDYKQTHIVLEKAII